jgi:hypothetical protein
MKLTDGGLDRLSSIGSCADPKMISIEKAGGEPILNQRNGSLRESFDERVDDEPRHQEYKYPK